MTKQELAGQIKTNLGITSALQDPRIIAIIEGLETELLKAHGITLDYEARMDHALFLIDYASYRYTNMKEDLPAHLRFRLIHLFLNEGQHSQETP